MKNELNILELINKLWKRRVFIIIFTLICSLALAMIYILYTPRYTITSRIKYSKFEFINLPSIHVLNVPEVLYKINESIYLSKPKEIINLKAEHVRDTEIIKIEVKTHKKEVGLEFTNSLIEKIKKENDEKLNVILTTIKNFPTQLTLSTKIKENLATQDLYLLRDTVSLKNYIIRPFEVIELKYKPLEINPKRIGTIFVLSFFISILLCLLLELMEEIRNYNK